MRRTPWQRIRDAAEKGTGCRLTPEDAARLGRDSAITQRAYLDDEMLRDHRDGLHPDPDCPWCGGDDLARRPGRMGGKND